VVRDDQQHARMDEFSVLIAGGGVAALEAALTLADVGEGRVRVELLSPEPQFFYRPAAVAEPFGLAAVRHFDLGQLAARAGAGMTIGRLAAIDADTRVAHTANGAELAYDALLIACGAVPTEVVRGALTFRGAADGQRLRMLLEELDSGAATSVAFVVPPGSAWPMPAYELALMTARRLAAAGRRSSVVRLVTPETHPLEIFGQLASDAVAGLLREAGVELVCDARAIAHDGRALLLEDGELDADRAVALPRLRGMRIRGVPQTDADFIRVDDHCAVLGLDAVFAAGDITSFSIKQGGIATQQAVVAAEAIAVLAGATLVPHPFRPVLRGLLLTGEEPAYLRRDLGEGGDGDWASGVPIWWPPTKIVGRRLTPFLASIAGEGADLSADVPPPAGLPVEARIAPEDADVAISVGLGF
jgi:sulfide:quinone oxidoreductase